MTKWPEYIESTGIKEKPFLAMTGANKGKNGYGNGEKLSTIFLEALHLESTSNTPIKGDVFFKAEGRVWKKEDPTLFVGDTETT